MRSERERLVDILEAIERIEKYAARGKSSFEDDVIGNAKSLGAPLFWN